MEGSQGGMEENRKAALKDVRARDGLDHRGCARDMSRVKRYYKVNLGGT